MARKKYIIISPCTFINADNEHSPRLTGDIVDLDPENRDDLNTINGFTSGIPATAAEIAKAKKTPAKQQEAAKPPTPQPPPAQG